MDELYEIYENTHYKSGWRPLTKEDDGDVLTTYKSAETPPKGKSAEKKTPVRAKEEPVPEERDVWKVLSEISAKLDTLSDRVLEQNEAINRLLAFMEAKSAESKKGALGFWGK